MNGDILDFIFWLILEISGIESQLFGFAKVLCLKLLIRYRLLRNAIQYNNNKQLQYLERINRKPMSVINFSRHAKDATLEFKYTLFLKS